MPPFQTPDRAPPAPTATAPAASPPRPLGGKGYAAQAAALSPGGGAAGAPAKPGGGGASVKPKPLPFQAQIQRSFGHHDVSAVKAFVGDDARAAGLDVGKDAYTQGNLIVFPDEPDLRTAAHEAAHYVQQAQGLAPAGGAGKPGDSFEKQAQAVAEKVVAGQPAAGLLDPAPAGEAAGGAPKVAKQGLHGDVEGARIHPELQASAGGATTVAAAVDKKFGGIERDENFNNKLKVDFECRLAALILGNGEWVSQPVLAVSRKMMAYLSAKAGDNKADLTADLVKLAKNLGGSEDKPNEVFFGRLADRIPAEKLVADGTVTNLLNGTGTLPQHLFAQHQFMDNIWHDGGKGDYWQNRKGQLTGIAEMVAPKQLRRGAASTVADPQQGGKTSSAGDVFGEKYVPEGQAQAQFGQAGGFKDQADWQNKAGMAGTTEAATGRHGRARFDAKTDKEGAAKGEAPRSRAGQVFGNPHGTTTDDASGIYARKGEGGAVQGDLGIDFKKEGAGEGQAHSRGVDRLTMDEEGLFMQQARLVLDMPLAGGISGTTTDMMECGKIFGLSQAEIWLYAVAVLGHLEGAGAHSFHEIATAATTAGISYKPGDYRSFLPATILAKGPVQALFTDPKFAGVPGIGTPAGSLTPKQAVATPGAPKADGGAAAPTR